MLFFHSRFCTVTGCSGSVVYSTKPDRLQDFPLVFTANRLSVVSFTEPPALHVLWLVSQPLTRDVAPDKGFKRMGKWDVILVFTQVLYVARSISTFQKFF